MSTYRPARILVMPEYAVGIPLWDRTEGRRGDFDPQALVSAGLAERLLAWNVTWESHPPEEPRRWLRADAEAWASLGHRLARQVQAELPDVEVLVIDGQGREVPVTN